MAGPPIEIGLPPGLPRLIPPVGLQAAEGLPVPLLVMPLATVPRLRLGSVQLPKHLQTSDLTTTTSRVVLEVVMGPTVALAVARVAQVEPVRLEPLTPSVAPATVLRVRLTPMPTPAMAVDVVGPRPSADDRVLA